MPTALCRYIRTTGIRCKSPALRNERFCYYHTALAKRHRYFRPNQVTDPGFIPGKHIRLPHLEDRHSLQMALSQTVSALAAGQIEVKAGIAVLYGLQQVLQNITRLEVQEQYTDEQPVQTVERSPDHLDLAPKDPDPRPSKPNSNSPSGRHSAHPQPLLS